MVPSHFRPIFSLQKLRPIQTVPSQWKSTSPPESHPSSKDRGFSFPYSKAQTGGFVQEAPGHENVFLGDAFLQRSLARMIPGPVVESMRTDLTRFGQRVSTDIWRLGRLCEETPPFLRQTSAWGERIDDIVTCEAWKKQKEVAAEEGLIAIAYERKLEEFSRLHQVVKLYMYGPSSGLYSCPLAMTDGAAKTIESNGLLDQLNLPYSHLTSRDPASFWTSGQWMTEKAGGSDVAKGTDTYAVLQDDGSYSLHGYKWFSSATDSDMALTLARIVDDEGKAVDGTKGISMFFVKTRRDDGSLNNINVAKLKNKLGTRQLPTGELILDGVRAQLISPPGRGIANISGMLTVTRMHNVLSSVGYMRRIILLARDYATRREAFGKRLTEHPLHLQALGRMEVECRGCTALMLDLGMKLGLDDAGKATDRDKMLLRLLMPVAKMYTGKKAVAVVSEGLECFGGQGYIEDTGLPGMLRDCQVLPIWEGTSNVMSLDVLRSIAKSNGEVLMAFKSKVEEVAKVGQQSNQEDIKAASDSVLKALNGTLSFVLQNQNLLEIASRDLTVSLAHIYISTLLLEHNLSLEHSTESDLATLSKFVSERDLAPVTTNFENQAYEKSLKQARELVFDGYNRANVYEPSYVQ